MLHRVLRRKSPPLPVPDRPIVLIGLMGAGKSSIGRRLATRLKLAFVDADEAIVEAAGMSIPDIFETFGEAYFRDGERRVIARLIEGGPQVIATGGGAFMQIATRTLILERGLAVWLDADIETLVERVARREGSRPLLNGKDARQVLSELAQVRNPVYAQAPVKVRSAGQSHEAMVREIIKVIRPWF
jgi:shikimate kinase